MEVTRADGYRKLLEQISDAYTQGRVRAVQAVNAQLIETYWRLDGISLNTSRLGNCFTRSDAVREGANPFPELLRRYKLSQKYSKVVESSNSFVSLS